jgi:hypothetical protein
MAAMPAWVAPVAVARCYGISEGQTIMGKTVRSNATNPAPSYLASLASEYSADHVAHGPQELAQVWDVPTLAEQAARHRAVESGKITGRPAFTYTDLLAYLTDHGRAPAPDSPSAEVGRTRVAQLGAGIEIHQHGGQVPASGGHPSEIHIVSTVTGVTEKLAVVGPDAAHARPGEEYGHTYIQVGAWLGRPTHDPAGVRSQVLRDNGVTGNVQPS